MNIKSINGITPMNDDDLKNVEGGFFVIAMTVCGVLGGLFWMGDSIGKDGADRANAKG